MARIPYPDPEKLPAEVVEELRGLPQMNTFRILGHAPATLGPWAGLGRALLTEGTLDPVLREISILRIAALSPGAVYEWDQHEAIARQVGVSDEQIEAARTGIGLAGDAEIIARFTEEVLRDVEASEAAWDDAVARFGPEGMVELVLLIGHYMGVARFVTNLRIDLDPAVGAKIFNEDS